MKPENLILLDELCVHFELERTFFIRLHDIGLIELHTIEDCLYIHPKKIGDVEKIIRLNHELDVNIEGIDVVFNLLQKIDELNAELTSMKNRLSLYEDDCQ